MNFDINGYIARIISNVRNNGVQPCTYHVFSHADGKGSTLHLGYKLAENTILEFNYNTRVREGYVLLSVTSDLLAGSLARQLSVQCTAFADKDEPLSCDEFITQKEVFQFMKERWEELNGSE